MSLSDLRIKYGKNLKRPQAINRAIREELVGGDDVLNALELTHRAVTRMRERGVAGVDDAQDAHDCLCNLRDLMVRIIEDRYDIGGPAD